MTGTTSIIALKIMTNIPSQTVWSCVAACALILAAGCNTQNQGSTATPAPAVATTTAAAPAPTPDPKPATQASVAPVLTPVSSAPVASENGIPALKPGTDGVYRVKAGSSSAFTDSAGHVWQAEVGFDGGDIVERDADTKIENTKDPGLFLCEHYSMNSFSCRIQNGKYLAKLYFAETFDGITGPGQRVFSFNVMGHQFKDVDLWKTAGALNRAYVETIPVEVTNGIFRIDFTSIVENPEINGIELVPQS